MDRQQQFKQAPKNGCYKNGVLLQPLPHPQRHVQKKNILEKLEKK